MREFSKIGEELFNKLRGRFSSVTIGDSEGNVTNEPIAARYFDFDYKGLGKVSVNLDEDEGLTVIFSKDFAEGTSDVIKKSWHDFLKELRVFGKKRMLDFSVRDITKSNLDKRDYKFLATNRSGDDKMTESKLYGTSRISYQNVGEARIMIKHTESVNQESVTGRTQKIGKIYIESPDGERFRYPYKHLSGARAMARHVAEGGNAYDDFGKHIVGLSEEMGKLRKFKNYMGRSAVMAESLAGYVDIVKERISTVKKTIESLQKPAYYAETFAAFETPVFEDVPSDVAENWIDELTIKQFNEELQDIFPYIYNLVKEGTKAKELGPDDLIDEGERHGNSKIYDKCRDGWKKKPGATRGSKGSCVKEEDELEELFNQTMGQFAEADSPGVAAMKKAGNAKADAEEKEGHDDMATAIKKKAKSVDEGPDGDEITLEKEQKTPLGEFILSYFDRENGQFPKGETAVLTMVEKDYGEQFIEPAKAFIEQVTSKFDEWQMRTQPQQIEGRYDGPNSSCCDAPIKNYENGMGICSDCGDNASPHEEVEEVVVGGNAKPADPNSMYARLMSDINEIQKGAMEGNDMADDIADELGDYLRNGDAPEGSVYEKAIGIVMDALHDGPDAQAEAAEQAGDFLHSELNKEDEVDEGQYDGKSREELLKMKDEAEASMKNYKPTGDDPQSRFYDETQMMMAQQHLDSINKALAKVGEATGDFDRMRELAGLR